MTNQLEIRHFEYFLALSETLHYRKAAEKLFISQSALSQQIQRLEAILGQELFSRTNRKVKLSIAGESFKTEAKLIMNQLQLSMERWQHAINGGGGILRIGFVGSAMQKYLPAVIKKFSKSYPNIKFYLEDLGNRDQLIALEQKKIDISFMRSNDLPATMNVRSVYEETLCLVLPNTHKITEENFKDISQVSDEQFILFPNQHSKMYYQQIINLCADHGFQPTISHRSIHGPTIFKLVENGLGISIIPSSLRDDYNYDVRFIELKDIPQRTELFAVWSIDNDNQALTKFLEMI